MRATTTTTTTTEAGFSLEHLNPADLVVGDNVRDGARLDKAFLASIKEHGVLTPITAVRLPDGTISVRDGQRRTEAARQAGLASIPAYIHDVAGDEKALRTRRVVEQIILNDRREALTDGERARGINQLLLDGVSPTKVAKHLSTPRATVDAAQSAAKSTTALSALDAGQLSLAEAVVFAEFDDDADAQAQLLDMAGSGNFEHRAERLRRDRTEREERAQAGQAWEAKGYRVLTDRPAWNDETLLIQYYLRTDDGEKVTDEFVEQADPKHWAVYLTREEIYVDSETGVEVDESKIDWQTADDPTLAAEEGYRHFSTVAEGEKWGPEYFCADVAGAGLRSTKSVSGRGYSAEDDDEQDREARAEQEREERRRVLALNKLGAAAVTVRQAWVRELLARKSAPKGTAVFVAQSITKHFGLIDDYRGKMTAAELLGCSQAQTPANLTEALSTTDSGDGRALVIVLGLVLGAMEVRTTKDSWRGPSEVSRAYLRFLSDNGYTLAEVEQVVVGHRTAEALYAQLTEQ
jgi:ParB family chromosome partitioning protein